MLTLQFIPHHEIQGLSQAKKIRKLLDIVKNNKIVLMEGKLEGQDEQELIKETMEAIDERFKGIEIATISPDQKEMSFMNKMRNNVADVLMGSRSGLTVIGPASVIKEIKQDPNKMQLYLVDAKSKKKKR